MLVHEIHTQRIFPVAQPLEIAERLVPAPAAVGFAQRAYAPRLVGGAAQLLHGADVAELRLRAVVVVLVEEHVDGGHLVPRVHGHIVAALVHARPVVFPVVPRPEHALAVAVGRHGLRPAVYEHLRQRFEVVVAHPFPVARLLGEQGQRSYQVVAPLFAEHFEQVGRPAHAARTGNARFVGEKPLDDRAQLLAEGLFVTFHGDAEEFFGDALDQQVDVRVTPVPARTAVIGLFVKVVFARDVFVAARVGGDVAERAALLFQAEEVFSRIGRGQCGFCECEPLSLVVGFGHLRGNMSACKAARVGVFVVDPDVEPQFFPLFHTVFIKVEPLVGEVFGDQPRPRVDEGAAEALRLEVAQHPVDVGAGDLCVPDPQGRRAECPRGIGEFLSELLEFHFPFLGGCGVAGEARCRQGGRQQAFDCGGFGFHGRSGLCLLYKGKGYALRAVTNPDKRLFISDKACGG